jgi:hypothetical protein
MSRKSQVLEHLRLNLNRWVDGTELATEEVGGSEGLKRLRELRTEGYSIERRKHPDPAREIHQYKLTATATRTAPVSRSENTRKEVQSGWDIPTYQPSDPEELERAWQQED